MEYVAIILTNILISNFILSRFLGICPFLGVSKQIETATGMGMAVIFVMTIASAATWLVQELILVRLGLEYLQTVAFILIIASIVQFVELVLMKTSPTLYQALGVYLPLITTNCGILGVAVININALYNFLQSAVSGLTAGMGFTLAIVLFAGIRERLELADIPESLEGFPIAMISAGLMSIAFLGFQGLFSAFLS
jgi:electron transport complex protein RnfA